jgi:hypothetical protein
MLGLGFAIAFIVVGVSFMGWKSLQLWRGDEAVQKRLYAATAVFPYGAGVRRGMVRGTCLLTIQLVMTGATLASAVQAMSSWHGGSKLAGWGLVAMVFLVLLLATIIVQFFVIFFNKPGFVVPPALRDELGAWQRGPRR